MAFSLIFKNCNDQIRHFNKIKSHFIFSSVSACSLGGTIQQLALDSLQFAARLHTQTNGQRGGSGMTRNYVPSQSERPPLLPRPLSLLRPALFRDLVAAAAVEILVVIFQREPRRSEPPLSARALPGSSRWKRSRSSRELFYIRRTRSTASRKSLLRLHTIYLPAARLGQD